MADIVKMKGRGRPKRETAADKAPGQVQALTRALTIINTLAESGDGMILADIAQTVGLAPSTAHRLLTTMQQQRFVRFDPGSNLWQVGVQAFLVGNAFLRTRDVVQMARPFMRRLMEESGETVNLAIEDQGEAIYMSQVECRQLMRAITRPGGRVLMHCSGIGKAILATKSDSEVRKILQKHGLPKVTEKTLHKPADLKADLKTIIERGYSIDDEENAIGLRCVAAVIRDEHGEALAGISLSGPMARITDDRLPILGQMVQATADDITAELGGMAGPPA
ncbi:MAG: IclR family transcriptional regulator C-terminal domain-containing protein [Pseudomonadota bacterium]